MLNVRPPDHLGYGIALDSQARPTHVTATGPTDLHPSLDHIHPGERGSHGKPRQRRELAACGITELFRLGGMDPH